MNTTTRIQPVGAKQPTSGHHQKQQATDAVVALAGNMCGGSAC
jgi:hypothetical protein